MGRSLDPPHILGRVQVLIIGGTRFVGRHLVEAARDRDHQVTLFNRGQTSPGLFPGVEELHGDRDGGLGVLDGRRWDAVVDTCGYVPRVVRASAEELGATAGTYTFVSSLSVYPDNSAVGLDETAPVAALDDSTVEEVTEETYGGLKASCESEVQRIFGDRALVLRCGLIVGPHDYTDRFTYWVRRVGRGGEVLAPDPPEYRIQVIDARDLAAWTVDMLERGQGGVFNTTGPRDPFTMEDFLHTCRAASGSDARFTWVAGDYLTERGVEEWSELPLWLPLPEYAGFMSVDVGRAVGAGLSFRPLEETVRDTLAWDEGRAADEPMAAGLSPDREADLLRAWRGRPA
jgi:nucleoside-diphosphate-sugar epimerase